LTEDTFLIIMKTEMKNKKHIVWYADIERLDFTHPWIRKWWIEQVLIHGTMEDVVELDFEEIRNFLPTLNLPKEIKNLWADYFAQSKKFRSP